jgi:hypothetical protein
MNTCRGVTQRIPRVGSCVYRVHGHSVWAMSGRSKKRLAFDATPERIKEITERAKEAGMTRQRYMEILLFGELIPDGRYKTDDEQSELPADDEQGETPMTT